MGWATLWVIFLQTHLITLATTTLMARTSAVAQSALKIVLTKIIFLTIDKN
jgi:hypothetical protein